MKIVASLGVAILVTVIVGRAAIDTTEDIELRDLELIGWDCANQFEGTAQSQDARERNRMKNRWPVNLSLFTVERLDTAGFLAKVREHDSRLPNKRRGELTTAQKNELDSYENQIVSLTGWLVVAYAGPPETTNCASAFFHDWHLEIFEDPSDHAPQIGDPTPIICEVTPRTEQRIYRDGKRIQSLAGFFRLQDASYQATGQGGESPRDRLSVMGRRPQRKRRCWFDRAVFQQEWIPSPLALYGMGDSSRHENRGDSVSCCLL